MKTLAVIAAVLLGLYFLGSRSEPAAASAPEAVGKVEVVSLNCRADSIRTWGEGSIRNTGQTTLKFPQVFVRFDDGTVGDYIAQPMTVPPGALATFGVVGPEGKHGCSVFAVQDNKGRSLL